MGVPLRNEELVSVRSLARAYSQLVDDLVEGRLEKVVVTRHGKMEAVLITVQEYERLIGDERPE